MLVENIIGSSRFSKPKEYDSWLDYWKAYTGKNPKCCAVDGCSGTDLVGAHVQKVHSSDLNWYIVPLCRACNQRTDAFEVNETLVHVPSSQCF